MTVYGGAIPWPHTYMAIMHDPSTQSVGKPWVAIRITGSC